MSISLNFKKGERLSASKLNRLDLGRTKYPIAGTSCSANRIALTPAWEGWIKITGTPVSGKYPYRVVCVGADGEFEQTAILGEAIEVNNVSSVPVNTIARAFHLGSNLYFQMGVCS